MERKSHPNDVLQQRKIALELQRVQERKVIGYKYDRGREIEPEETLEMLKVRRRDERDCAEWYAQIEAKYPSIDQGAIVVRAMFGKDSEGRKINEVKRTA